MLLIFLAIIRAVDQELLMISRKLAFLALCALSASSIAREIGLAKAHPEYHISLGGKFIDHLAAF